MKTVFLRLLEADDKPEAMLAMLREESSGCGRFEVDPSSFASVPRSPFAYWAPASLLEAFTRFGPLKNKTRFAARGPYTLDDFRFVRLTVEVNPRHLRNTRPDTLSNPAWVRFLKGGAFSRYYSDPHLVLDWSEEGEALKAHVSAYRDAKGWGPNWTAAINGYEYYFRPGATWTHRTTSPLSMRAMPAGCIFSAKGPALLVDDEDERLVLLGLCNSRAFQALFEMSLGAADAAARSYDVGIVQRLPMPIPATDVGHALSALAGRAWSLRRSLDTTDEISHAFALPAALQVPGIDLAARSVAWSDQIAAAEDELARIQAEIDERCFELYGIDETDRGSIVDGFGAATVQLQSTHAVEDGEGQDAVDAAEEQCSVDAGTLAAELVSWAVGVAFGRFDLRLATGNREIPADPEPFDVLPLCSPGTLTRDDGLPAPEPPRGYPLSWPGDGVLVDDEGHPDDIGARVREVFAVVFGNEADVWWQECAQLLGGSLRRWLAHRFFDAHLKGYSRSRRKAPIYWQLATPTGGYSVWLYAHRANPDTLFRVLNDFVTPKLRHEERKLTSLTQDAGLSASASRRKDIESQRGLVEELGAFRDEVARVVPLWRPELDDGIVVTCAPLWRLVPQHRVWQREVRARWAKAANGEHDWAHLAMHLWPERVVPKCAHDRSLAIAHGLEDEFWAEDGDGKWAPRQIDGASVERLVQERSSAAVKAALATLLAAG
jgi:hypothetical protein